MATGKPARPEMLEIERKIAATAALYWPGGEWAALWQTPPRLATLLRARKKRR